MKPKFLHSPYIKCLSLLIFNYSLLINCSAQDPQFTQSFGAMTYNNPSFSGSDTMGTVFITHRNQWPKLSGTYQTTVFGWQQYIGKINSYAGFHYMYDKAGVMTTQRFTLNYSQNIKIKKLLLRPSFEAVFFQKEIDWSQLTFGDQIDPRRGFVYQTNDIPRGGSISNVDFNAGLLANFYNVTLGISVHHLTQPNEALMTGNSPLPMKIGLQFGYSLQIGLPQGILKLDPYMMYYSQNNFQLLQGGMNINYRNILIGYMIRNKDSYAFLGGFKNERFTIAYSYDITTSSLGNSNTGGSHEFTTAFRFWKCKAHKKFLETRSPFY
jgi:type IX secretion system PorP/SprF family membrane protein